MAFSFHSPGLFHFENHISGNDNWYQNPLPKLKLALKHDRLSNKRLSFSNVCRLLLYWKIIVSGLFTVHMLICWSIVQKTMFTLAKTKILNWNNLKKVLLDCGWKVWESLETHFTQILNEMCQQIWNPCDRKLWIIRI